MASFGNDLGKSRTSKELSEDLDQEDVKPEDKTKSFNVKSRGQDIKQANDLFNQGVEIAEKYTGVMDKLSSRFNYFFDLTFILDKFIQLFRDAINTTKTMDKDLTQIGLVIGKTSGEV